MEPPRRSRRLPKPPEHASHVSDSNTIGGTSRNSNSRASTNEDKSTADTSRSNTATSTPYHTAPSTPVPTYPTNHTIESRFQPTTLMRSSFTRTPQLKLRLKCYYNNEIRAVQITDATSFKNLKSRLVKDYGFDLTLMYEDCDQDMIMLATQNDLVELIECEGRVSLAPGRDSLRVKSVKVFVTRVESKSKEVVTRVESKSKEVMHDKDDIRPYESSSTLSKNHSTVIKPIDPENTRISVSLKSTGAEESKSNVQDSTHRTTSSTSETKSRQEATQNMKNRYTKVCTETEDVKIKQNVSKTVTPTTHKTNQGEKKTKQNRLVKTKKNKTTKKENSKSETCEVRVRVSPTESKLETSKSVKEYKESKKDVNRSKLTNSPTNVNRSKITNSPTVSSTQNNNQNNPNPKVSPHTQKQSQNEEGAEDTEYDFEWQWQKGEVLGQGAFGTVYLGLNLNSGELMAVKQIDTNAVSSKDVLSMKHEVEMMRGLAHPNIVRYLGTEFADDALSIFLEYVPGGSLRSLVGRFGRLQESVIRVYTRQLLLGLEYLHMNGIAHRDIKGANVLVANDGTIKLADFGASKRVSSQSSLVAGIKGTPMWMAPEVIKNHKSSRGWKKADIWSVGCTVIEMSSGSPPWSQYSNPVTAMYHIACVEEVPSFPDSLSDAGCNFLSRCLQRRADLRPDVTSLLLDQFVAFFDGAYLAVGQPSLAVARLNTDIDHAKNGESKILGGGTGNGKRSSSPSHRRLLLHDGSGHQLRPTTAGGARERLLGNRLDSRGSVYHHPGGKRFATPVKSSGHNHGHFPQPTTSSVVSSSQSHRISPYARNSMSRQGGSRNTLSRTGTRQLSSSPRIRDNKTHNHSQQLQTKTHEKNTQKHDRNRHDEALSFSSLGQAPDVDIDLGASINSIITGAQNRTLGSKGVDNEYEYSKDFYGKYDGDDFPVFSGKILNLSGSMDARPPPLNSNDANENDGLQVSEDIRPSNLGSSRRQRESPIGWNMGDVVHGESFEPNRSKRKDKHDNIEDIFPPMDSNAVDKRSADIFPPTRTPPKLSRLDVDTSLSPRHRVVPATPLAMHISLPPSDVEESRYIAQEKDSDQTNIYRGNRWREKTHKKENEDDSKAKTASAPSFRDNTTKNVQKSRREFHNKDKSKGANKRNLSSNERVARDSMEDKRNAVRKEGGNKASRNRNAKDSQKEQSGVDRPGTASPIAATRGVGNFRRRLKPRTSPMLTFEPEQVFKGHTAPITSLDCGDWTAGLDIITTGSADCTARLWNSSTGKEVSVMRHHSKVSGPTSSSARTRKSSATGKGVAVTVAKLHCRADMLLTGGADGSFWQWDLETGQRKRKVKAHDESLSCITIDEAAVPDEVCRVLTAGGNTIFLWDMRSRRPLLGSLKGHTDTILCVDLIPSSMDAVSCGKDQTVKIWDLRTGRLRATGTGHFSQVGCLKATGASILSGGRDGSIKVWRRNGTCKRTLRGHSSTVTHLALPVGRGGGGGRVLSSSGSSVRLWNYMEGRCLSVLGVGKCRTQVKNSNHKKENITGHSANITAILWPSSSISLSGDRSGALFAWNMADNACLGQLRGHTAAITQLAPHGANSVLSASRDGTIMRWKMPSMLG